MRVTGNNCLVIINHICFGILPCQNSQRNFVVREVSGLARLKYRGN